ncbi:MAG: hypothetical protein U1E97_02665 [Alphaproteobacteria bacterium]
MATSKIRVSASGAVAGDATDWLQLRGGRRFFDISVAGTFNQTIILERKRPGEADGAARVVESFSAAAQKVGEIAGHWDLRLRVTAVTSGTSSLELGV